MEYSSELLAKIKNAPAAPGCYLYSDQYENIIYVGKAKSLKKRVASYFTPAAARDERLEDLLPRITDVSYQECGSELDALILEYLLIKKHKPWFNTQMKPDKQRPFLRIGPGTPYQTLSAAAKRAEDGGEYYDAFTDEVEIRAFLGVFGHVWGTAQCGKVRLPAGTSPCLYHSLGQCLAPCAGKADETQYGEAVNEIRNLLQTKHIGKLEELKQEMDQAAERLDFERAAQYKWQMQQLRRLQQKAKRMYHYPPGANVLVLLRSFRNTAITIFGVRDGTAAERLDAAENASVEDLEHFAGNWNDKSVVLEDGLVLAKCLTEISADRLFVKMPGQITATRLFSEIKKFEKLARGGIDRP